MGAVYSSKIKPHKKGTKRELTVLYKSREYGQKKKKKPRKNHTYLLEIIALTPHPKVDNRRNLSWSVCLHANY